MLTLRTKLALAVLHDIQYKDYQLSTSLNPSPKLNRKSYQKDA